MNRAPKSIYPASTAPPIAPPITPGGISDVHRELEAIRTEVADLNDMAHRRGRLQYDIIIGVMVGQSIVLVAAVLIYQILQAARIG